MGLLSGFGSVIRVMADALDPNRDAFDPRFWADAGNISVAGVTVTEQKVSQLKIASQLGLTREQVRRYQDEYEKFIGKKPTAAATS
jgi:hypothetical protein